MNVSGSAAIAATAALINLGASRLRRVSRRLAIVAASSGSSSLHRQSSPSARDPTPGSAVGVERGVAQSREDVVLLHPEIQGDFAAGVAHDEVAPRVKRRKHEETTGKRPYMA